MTELRRVDAHVHLWKLSRGDYSWMTPDLTAIYRDFDPVDLAPHLNAAGMKETVLVQAADTIAETEYLLDLAARTKFISGVVGWLDMEAADFCTQLDRLSANPYFKGIRPMIQDIPDVDWMLHDRQRAAFDALAERKTCFDLLVKPPHLNNVLTLLNRHPDLHALIDHGAKPEIAAGRFDDWAAAMKSIADNTGILCKLSGLITEAGPQWSVEMLRPYVDHLLECFGPNRLVFGSDWPVLTLGASYDAWYDAATIMLAGLNDAERAAIFGNNAARFYRL